MYMKKRTVTEAIKQCEHKNQYYMQSHGIGRSCYAWNTCNDCGVRLMPDIYKAEENNFFSPQRTKENG
jgi:hypothetical protein